MAFRDVLWFKTKIQLPSLWLFKMVVGRKDSQNTQPWIICITQTKGILSQWNLRVG